MKKFIQFLISFLLVSAFFLPRVVDLLPQQAMLLFSTLPVLAIFKGINESRFTFREVKHQKIRLAAYGLSMALFIICLLSAAGVISITHIEPGMAEWRRTVIKGMLFSIFSLLIVNLIISIRDINRRESGRPL